MSTRQSREELIKKGVLKEVYEKGEKIKSSMKYEVLKEPVDVLIDLILTFYQKHPKFFLHFSGINVWWYHSVNMVGKYLDG